MARRNIGERNVRKLFRIGNGDSIAVTIPVEFARELKLRAKQKVVVKKSGKKLIIEDWKK